MPPYSQLSGQGFPSDRPVNGAFQGVRNLYLRLTPKSHEESPLATRGVTHGIPFRHSEEDKRREF
jgi:hypothetical protein